MIENKLAPSILSIDFGHMERELKKTETAGATMIHVDVMDGDFVPNISFGMPIMKYVRKALPNAIIDVHMMVKNPLRFLDDFASAGANVFTIHYEAVRQQHVDLIKDVRENLRRIKAAGIKCGLSLKPATPVSVVKDLIDDLDVVLVMSVEPGFGGQKFIPETYGRIAAIREMAEAAGKELDIEVDGGVTLENIRTVLDSGANVIVAGSAVFTGDVEKNVKDFLEIMS
ncbi:MAG: ribulose-phosphate 3-epimerase [Eubacterium sp.]|nr:ribulose-phosphate 3-epimerase [Eubacterium sp.]